MTRRSAAAAAAAALGVLVTRAAAAPPQYGTLPSPSQPFRSVPPLTAPQPALSEQRILGRLRATEHVRVGVDRSGRPVRVTVDDRLELVGKGDYSFVVPAPVEDVRPLAGSDSAPGLRTSGVVWQGFSPGVRRLAARVVVRADAAARALPLRITVGAAGLRLENATKAATTALAAPASPRALAAALDTARVAVARGRSLGAQVLRVGGAPRSERVRVVLPLEVRGFVRFTGGTIRVRSAIGEEPLSIRGDGELRHLELQVVVPSPRSLLTPSGAPTWRALAGRGGLGNGLAATRASARRLLSAALAMQFHAFLANPLPGGRATTTYEYRLAFRATRSATDRGNGGSGWWLPAALAVGGILLAGGMIVLWARS